MNTGYYIISVWGGVETELHGPYESDEQRDEAAKRIRATLGEESSVHALDAIGAATLTLSDYSGAFFMETIASVTE
jgi:hypothetical protein